MEEFSYNWQLPLLQKRTFFTGTGAFGSVRNIDMDLLYNYVNLLHVWYFSRTLLKVFTEQKMEFSIKDFFSKCDQIRSFLRIWSHLLKKSLMEIFIFCAVFITLAWFDCDLKNFCFSRTPLEGYFQREKTVHKFTKSFVRVMLQWHNKGMQLNLPIGDDSL